MRWRSRRFPTPLDRRARRDLRRGARLHRQVGALQPGARARRRSRCTGGRSTSRRRSCCRRRPSRSPRSSSSPTATELPVVPRAGGTGLTDGAVPLQARDPRRRQADEPDPRDRPRGPHRHGRPGINMLKLSEELRPLRRHLPGQPGLVPVLARRRADRHERLVADRRALRAHARPRDLVRDRAADGRDHPGRRGRRQEDPQVVLRLPAQAPLHGPSGNARHRHRGDARAGPAAGGGVLGVLRLSELRRTPGRRRASFARSGSATLAGVVLFDEWKVEYLRRDDEAYIPQPDWVKSVVAVALVRARRTSCAPAPRSHAHRQGVRRRRTWATRSPRATGPRATTATRRRCTAARRTDRSCR